MNLPFLSPSPCILYLFSSFLQNPLPDCFHILLFSPSSSSVGLASSAQVCQITRYFQTLDIISKLKIASSPDRNAYHKLQCSSDRDKLARYLENSRYNFGNKTNISWPNSPLIATAGWWKRQLSGWFAIGIVKLAGYLANSSWWRQA